MTNVFDSDDEPSKDNGSDETPTSLPPTNQHDHGDATTTITTTVLPPVITSERLPEKLFSSGIKSPDYVKKLSFVGNIPIQLPSAFLSICKNLTGIHFHLSSLVGIAVIKAAAAMGAQVSLTLDVPTLKTLVFDSSGLNEMWESTAASLRPVTKLGHVLDLVINFLEQNNFPHLDNLIVDSPLCLDKENAVISSISSFLSRHWQSVQSFCYHQGFVVVLSPDSDEEELSNPENQVSLSNLAFSSTQLKKVSLTDLHVGLYRPQESGPLWINFLIQQAHLEKMIFTGDPIPFPANTVKANQSTLTTLICELRDSVDCAYLKDCIHLRKLSLLGKNEDEIEDQDIPDIILEADDEDNHPHHCNNILDLILLPVTLENLRINRLKVDAKAITEIICGGRWDRLKRLELIDCGVEGNLGVPLQTIGHIMQAKQLTWFQIDYSLNRKSVTEKNISAPLQMLAYALRNNSISSFTIQGHLDAMTGVYEPCKSTGCNDDDYAGPEMDLFQFPDEISPTGVHRKSSADEVPDDDHDYSSSGDGSSDGGNDFSYEDLTDDGGEAS
ncbi:uncharacterized protein LOC118433358 [Folsomia candida]|nr:uncharacterized protein LOC118433358 [Folsomia candida]